MTVHIVQPALPGYRVAFFRELQRELSKRDERLHVHASARDHLNVESVAPVGFGARLGPAMSVHLAGNVLWQPGLDVPLTRGDILVINGNPRLLSNYPLWVRAKLLGIPVVWWGHGWSPGSHGHLATLRRMIMHLADAVILYTEKERDEYIARGFPPRRTFALNNGIDVGSVDKAIGEWNSARIQEFRSANGLDACAHWCIFIGRLSGKSQIGLLIDSLPAIRGDTGVIILGDGPIAEEAKERARAIGVDSRVIWAGSQFDENAIAPWMLSASAFTYPGIVGLSLIHGFAYGLPAVVHGDRRKQMPEFAAFEDYGNGLCFDCGSAESLALKINELFDDDRRRESMSRRALALVHRTFNVQDMAGRFVEVIDKLRFRAASYA